MTDERVAQLDAEITQLTEQKKELIERVTKAMKELKYKTIELNALRPMAEKAKKMELDRLIRKLKSLEFKVATSALTPKAEKKYLDRILKIEKQLKKVRPYLRAEKRVKILEEDIEKLQAEIKELDEKLKEIRKNIRELIKKKRMIEKGAKKGIELFADEPDHMVSLEDVVVIEKED